MGKSHVEGQGSACSCMLMHLNRPSVTNWIEVRRRGSHDLDADRACDNLIRYWEVLQQARKMLTIVRLDES